MKKFIPTIFLFFLLLLISSCDVLDKYPSDGKEVEPINKGIEFEVREGHNLVDRDPPVEPGIVLSMVTEGIYPCLNYHIVSEGNLGSKSLHVEVAGAALTGEICLTANGPASTRLYLDKLKPGRYDVSFLYQENLEWFELVVTDSSLVVEGEPNFFKPKNRRYWRFPKRSFVYRCRDSSDYLNTCREFQQEILAQKFNLISFSFPADGIIPFNLKNTDITAFYRYREESTFDKIGDALIAYADTALDANSNIRMSVENWLAKEYETE